MKPDKDRASFLDPRGFTGILLKSTGGQMQNHQNPLLSPFTHRDESVPFNQIKAEHFLPAIDEAIRGAKLKIEALKQNKSPAQFENVLMALEEATEQVGTVSLIFHNLFVAEADAQLQQLAQEISPKLAAFSSDVSLDPVIFQRVKAVYDQRQQLNLNAEQMKVVENSYLGFTRNGALLSPDKKEILRSLDQELSTLGPKFSENILKSTNSYELWLQTPEELDGLPEGAVEAAKAAATAKGQPEQWLFTLQAPSFIPFITYSSNRNLREKIWRAYNSRAFNDAYDNQENILKIVKLRHQRAQLLGFNTHAEYVLAERMAKDTGSVMSFLNKLMGPSKLAAERDLKEVQDFAGHEIKPWDFNFYSEKLKEKKYAFNEEELRPYFKLENVVNGVFEHARRLYGLAFTPVHDVPTYHPDVQVYEVKDERRNKYIGLFYTDFFPRETKKDGAWMTSYREQGLSHGRVQRPHVSIVCNFTKPTPTKPSLLSYDEVGTLFHEFGHALHGLLSDCTYKSVSGTNVYWDFVELPSQIMENWIKEKESLDLFAKHYETGESIPQELVEKIKKSTRFQSGWMSLRQLNFALLDMSWHSQDPQNITKVDDFEVKSTSAARLLPKIEGTNSSCAFSHIFAGGYSAGYYSYKWAEVLDADAFEYFQEQGLFNTTVADKFKENILSRGGSEHPMDLYKKFRGREPDPNALLRRDGLI